MYGLMYHIYLLNVHNSELNSPLSLNKKNRIKFDLLYYGLSNNDDR